jgi:hypothetical protein
MQAPSFLHVSADWPFSRDFQVVSSTESFTIRLIHLDPKYFFISPQEPLAPADFKQCLIEFHKDTDIALNDPLTTTIVLAPPLYNKLIKTEYTTGGRIDSLFVYFVESHSRVQQGAKMNPGYYFILREIYITIPLTHENLSFLKGSNQQRVKKLIKKVHQHFFPDKPSDAFIRSFLRQRYADNVDKLRTQNDLQIYQHFIVPYLKEKYPGLVLE